MSSAKRPHNRDVAQRLALAILATAASAVALAAQVQPVVVVTPSTAEFVIPVVHEGPWRWYRTDTSDNAREFRWELGVKSRSGDYQFGFSIFKYPGSKERTGSLADLLNAGQASLWKVGPSGEGTLIEGAKVSALADRGGIVIRLSDPASVRLVFGDRPAAARAFAETPDADHQSQDIAVEYRQ